MPLIAVFLSHFGSRWPCWCCWQQHCLPRGPYSRARRGAGAGRANSLEVTALRTTNQALGATIDRQNAAVAELKARADAAENAMAVAENAASRAGAVAEGAAEQQGGPDGRADRRRRGMRRRDSMG